MYFYELVIAKKKPPHSISEGWRYGACLCAILGCHLLRGGTATEAVGQMYVTKNHFPIRLTPYDVYAQFFFRIPINNRSSRLKL